MARHDPDATLKLEPPRHGSVGGVRRKTGYIAATAALLVAVAAVGMLAVGVLSPTPPVPTSTTAPDRVAQSPPGRGETEILAQRADTLIVGRFGPNRQIVVLDFPNLTAQGLAFNRMAAFIEKRGMPRDRVLTDSELANALVLDNSDVATYYYGHDYRAEEVRRFFSTARKQNLALGLAEQELYTILNREGMLADSANLTVISIPREGSDPFVDASGRASLLRHELSHGEYFTNPIYASFVRRFWTDEMTAADREDFRRFLSQQGYDGDSDDLMANETQAHLMHTTDGRYFNARDCGIPRDRISALRAVFLAKMPPGWLRDAAIASRPSLPE